MIELKKINKTYKTETLKDISIKFEDKGLIFILGKSGSGKSTLLNIIGGLDKYDNGDLLINGKSTNKFKTKDFDAYRNTYIGFVFQDFNLLENYSVYQNISLALELQNKNESNNKIDEILKIVNLEKIGNKKTNELSSDEKQRIAIARALIKNPDVLLANEPTRNLDNKTGNQIFELFKRISQEKLVIIVSEDEESAKKYADRIIELKDGIITNDTKEITNLSSPKEFKLINAKLPFKYSFKMGLENLFHKKIKLFLTLLLTTFSLIYLGLTMTANSFNLNEKHIDTLIKNSEYEVIVNNYSKIIDYEQMSLNKNLYFGDEYNKPLEISDEIFTQAQNKTKLKWYKQFTIVQDAQSARFEFSKSYTDMTLYYQFILPLTFVELEKNDTLTNLIGSLPNNSDEIVVSNYIADNIIQNGIYLNKENNKDTEIYKPQSYNQIISDNKYIQISILNKKVKIVGIIENDLTEILPLKNVTWNDYETNTDYVSTYNYLLSNTDKYTRIYVTKDFISSLKLKENNIAHETTKILIDNNYYTVPQLGYISNELEAFNGNSIIKFNTLKDNEIIIDINILNDITNNDYQNKLDNYFNNTSDTYPLSNEEFTKDYIKKNNIINRIIKTNVTNNKITNTTENYQEYVIKGVILKDSTFSRIYYSKDKVNKIITKNIAVYDIFTVANTKEDLIKIFEIYPIDKASTLSKTKYSEELLDSALNIYQIKSIGKYGSIFILIFTILILTNFINASINYRKKELSILRTLGCKNKDIFKIFVIESSVLVIICLLFANIGINIIINLFNNALSNNIKFLVYRNIESIWLIAITILIIVITILIARTKIVKMKPTDIIT